MGVACSAKPSNVKHVRGWKRGELLLATLCLGVGAWGEISAPSQPWPVLELDATELALRPTWSYLAIPDAPPAPTAEERLGRRLAALAVVRDRQRSVERDGLLEFDVEGLTRTFETVLGKVQKVAQVSVHVRDLATQHVLFDRAGDRPLIPASNQKIVTTSAALDLLGADYTFRTAVVESPGRLCLVGQGDPALATEHLADLAQRVAQAVDLDGVETLVIDDSAFTPEVFGPGYAPDGTGVAYQAPSGALSVDFNTVEVRVAPTRAGHPAQVEVTPASRQLDVVANVTTGKRTSVRVVSHAEEGRTRVEVAGTVRRRGRSVMSRRRVGDPGLFTGGVFAAQLVALGASETLPVQRGACGGAEWTPVAAHRSAPLVEILDRGMAYSNNFIAEQVLRTLAWRATGQPGDWSSGRHLLAEYWSAIARRSEAIIANGSGLSRDARLTTRGLVDLISAAYRGAEEGTSLLDTLPVAGEPGTLRSRLRRSGKRVRAKTGTLAGVSGLTGVITRPDGTPQLAFSILTNVTPSRKLYARARRKVEDRLVMALLDALDAYESRREPS